LISCSREPLTGFFRDGCCRTGPDDLAAHTVWNCEHLANANTFGHIRRINTMLGIGCPVLVTPLELLDEETNDE
jgi:uncharacterized protein (DUF2237 family)